MLLKKILGSLDSEYISGLSRAGTMGLHLVSGVLVGALIGFFFDKWLETTPWFFGIFIFIGILSGFKNVYDDAKRLVIQQEQLGADKNTSQD